MEPTQVIVTADNVPSEIGTLSLEEIDALPFGAIHLDESGRVRVYNSFEEAFSGKNRRSVIGRDFFHEVAPCTRIRAFYGLFLKGVQQKSLSEVFDYVFRFPTGSREVRIRMLYSALPQPGVWIFVTPMRR